MSDHRILAAAVIDGEIVKAAADAPAHLREELLFAQRLLDNRTLVLRALALMSTSKPDKAQLDTVKRLVRLLKG